MGPGGDAGWGCWELEWLPVQSLKSTLPAEGRVWSYGVFGEYDKQETTLGSKISLPLGSFQSHNSSLPFITQPGTQPC